MDIMSPDDIVTLDDVRGMQTLLRLLGPGSPSARAATALLQTQSSLLICTGFPVAGTSETDGPPGAAALGRALSRLQRSVSIVSWPEALEAWSPILGDLDRIAVPIGQAMPPLSGAAVTIEACGRLADGRYENMRGENVTAHAPWFEHAIGLHALISIGDGGNEYGMGSAPSSWFQGRVRPPISTCDVLVVGQVSNWAALAIVAALSHRTGQALLPSPEEYQYWLEQLALKGVVDGVTKSASATEDGALLGKGPELLARLHDWLARAS